MGPRHKPIKEPLLIAELEHSELLEAPEEDYSYLWQDEGGEG